MPSSDSEGFESADEGRSSIDKKERKKRLSSSNYSDNTLESDAELKKDKEVAKEKNTVQTDGWDDFEFNDNEEPTHTNVPVSKEKSPSKKPEIKEKEKIEEKSQDTGWDEFGDWGNDNITTQAPTKSQSPDPDIKAVTDRLAAATTSGTDATPTSGGGWGWGWGVDSLLSSTTAGLTTLTNQVSQGITSVLETGIGAPDPEELARQAAASKTPDEKVVPQESGEKSAGDAGFSFGSILKFVGDTGTNIIAGGLDTLETIGRKAMDVLQEGDPYLAKKRALLGLDPDKPVLSQVLREAKAKAEEEDRIREEKREAKEIHYENLFDDFGGLVHLEALEMLSKQINMRIEEQLRNAKPADRSEMKETLQQVIELCEMADDEESSDEDEDQDKLSPAESFHQKLVAACADLSIQLQFSPIVKHYTETLDYLKQESELTVKGLHKRAIGDLAQATALSVELYHKASEQMAVLTRRSTADEADAITRLTVVLTKHVNHLATLFTVKLQEVSTPEVDEQAKAYITNVFLEADNSSSYIHSAFLLTQPILQIGSI